MFGRLFLIFGIAAPAIAADYTIGSGDKLSVHVYGEPDLSRDLVVDDTCRISVGLVGRVDVCGMTSVEVESLITERLASGYLVHPQVAVSITEFRSQWIEVEGEVQRRGRQFLDGPTTLGDAINAAGGPRAENVVDVTVYSTTGETQRYDLVDLVRMPPIWLRHGDRVALNPGRLVYVQGEVHKEGPVVFREGLTVTQALAMAGGPGEYANLRRVSVIRADGQKVHLNVARVNQGLASDLVLGPDDRLVINRGVF